MGATFILNDKELASILPGTHLPTSEEWKVELAKQREDIRRSVGMTSTGNQTRVAHVVAQWFTRTYIKATLSKALL